VKGKRPALRKKFLNLAIEIVRGSQEPLTSVEVRWLVLEKMRVDKHPTKSIDQLSTIAVAQFMSRDKRFEFEIERGKAHWTLAKT
jgi:hypothetical protein